MCASVFAVATAAKTMLLFGNVAAFLCKPFFDDPPG
jgi:hypothetical protein